MEFEIIKDPSIVHKNIFVQLDDGSRYTMHLSALYINYTLWLFNVVFNEPITSDDIHDLVNINKDVYMGVMDKTISKFLKLGYNLDNYNIVGTIKEKIVRVTRFYGEIVANTFSLFDIMMFESRSPEFSELFNSVLDIEVMSSKEIETYTEVANDALYDIVVKDNRSTLYPAISTNIVNRVQMGQMFIGVGTRYDIDKTILPVSIKRGWIHGLSSISEFFAESISTRNSIIIKKDAVPNAGYLSRKVNIGCIGTILDNSIYDCGSRHYMSYYVKNEVYLKIVEGKYMVIDDSIPLMKEVSINDKHLIGTVIRIRSHTKCITGHYVNKVCCICLGNKHISLNNARIGGLVSIKAINPVTQLGLSSKHALSTNSEEVTGAVFDRYFTISKSSVFPKKDVTASMRCQLLIPIEIVNDIISSNDIFNDGGEIDEGLNFAKVIDYIFVVDNGVLRGMDLEDKSFFVYISDNLISAISSGKLTIVRAGDIVHSVAEIESTNENLYTSEIQDMEFVAINFSEFDSSESVFELKILTEEVSKYLRITKNIIDGAKTLTYTSTEEPLMDFLEVLLHAKISTNGIMIHIETLIMNLMRNTVSIMERPDYSQIIEPEIRIIKLSQAIQKSDLFSGMVSEDIKRQFGTSDVLKKKSPGVFDAFFKNIEFLKKGEEFRTTRPYLFNNVPVVNPLEVFVNKK